MNIEMIKPRKSLLFDWPLYLLSVLAHFVSSFFCSMPKGLPCAALFTGKKIKRNAWGCHVHQGDDLRIQISTPVSRGKQSKCQTVCIQAPNDLVLCAYV